MCLPSSFFAVAPPAGRALPRRHGNCRVTVGAIASGAALIAVGVWQALVFIGLRGWPINLITKRHLRLLAGNALTIGLGAATYAVLRDAAGLEPAHVGAICGCVLGGVLVAAMLFESWPGALLSPRAGPGRGPGLLRRPRAVTRLL